MVFKKKRVPIFPLQTELVCSQTDTLSRQIFLEKEEKASSSSQNSWVSQIWNDGRVDLRTLTWIDNMSKSYEKRGNQIQKNIEYAKIFCKYNSGVSECLIWWRSSDCYFIKPTRN